MSEYIVEVDGQMPDAVYERKREEIVRCRDCKHYREGRHGLPNACRLWYPNVDLEEPPRTEPDGFCAWGVRKGAAE